MVGIAQKTSGGVGGVGGGHIPWAGHFYSMANIIANNTAEVFVPADLAGARQSFAGLSTNLNSDDSIGILPRSSAIKATIDTLLETSGWINVTQEEATQAGTGRQWDPAIKGRRQDAMRVLDQSIARTAAIDSNIALGNATALSALHGRPRRRSGTWKTVADRQQARPARPRPHSGRHDAGQTERSSANRGERRKADRRIMRLAWRGAPDRGGQPARSAAPTVTEARWGQNDSVPEVSPALVLINQRYAAG
jgi:hypothetical protein